MKDKKDDRPIDGSAQNRVVLISGATGAIGKAIARQMAADPAYEVVLAVRNKQKAEGAVKDIIRATANNKVRYELVDLSRRASIEDLAGRWRGPLHILINNAATAPRKRLETPEGIEMQFAANVLGYFWMTRAFSEKLKQSAPSRVVNVASYWAGDLDIKDLEFKKRPYNNNRAYRQSKQANRMLTVALAKRLQPYRISVNVCHPGEVNSRLSNELGFGGSQSPAEGARTPLWLATNSIGQTETGKYFENNRQVRCVFGEDEAAVEQLYRICAGY